ncbi:hypothetical protein PRIPAC_87591, partial [Pristionchus pacificus]|uniref:Zinc finger protein n=1 Tax=Pristionchus pacificus TaxID=54126 RepID=A0A2A6CX00_PRIPA
QTSNSGFRTNAISVKRDLVTVAIVNNIGLPISHHIDQITRKARSMCNLMLRSFLTTSSDVLRKAYKIYIRPLLESSTVIWNPTAIGLVNKLESVQREFTRRIFWRSHLSQSSYPQRLEHFKLETLEYRRALNDMYFLFDSAHGFVHLDTSNIYSIAPLSRTLRSSHRLRLTIPFLMPSSLSTFASRPLTLWNSLSNPIVTLPRIPFPDDAPERRKFKCETCDNLFVTHSGLKKHTILHLDDNDPEQSLKKRPFKCETCAKRFIRNSHLKFHMTTHMKFEIQKIVSSFRALFDRSEMRVECVKLRDNYPYSNKNDPVRRPYPCDMCTKRFTQLIVLQMHKRKIHLPKDDPIRRKFECEICHKFFSEKGDF